MTTVEIFYDDLTPEKQSEILRAAGLTNSEDGNFEILPLAIVDFEPDDNTDSKPDQPIMV